MEELPLQGEPGVLRCPSARKGGGLLERGLGSTCTWHIEIAFVLQEGVGQSCP